MKVYRVVDLQQIEADPHCKLIRFALDSPRADSEYYGEGLKVSGWLIRSTHGPVDVFVRGGAEQELIAVDKRRVDVPSVRGSNGATHDAKGFSALVNLEGPLSIGLRASGEEYPLYALSVEADEVDLRQVVSTVVNDVVEARRILFGERQAVRHDDSLRGDYRRLLDGAYVQRYGILKPLAKAVAGVVLKLLDGLNADQEIREFRRSFGQDAFVGLKSMVNGKILSARGRELTHHGVKRTFRFWSQEELRNYVGVASDVTALLAGAGYPSFFFYGTMLGVIRGFAPIPHDDDFDLAYVVEANAEADVPDYLRLLSDVLEPHGYSVSGDFPGHRHVRIGNVRIDVFVGIAKDGAIDFPHFKRYRASVSDVLPVIDIEFMRHRCSMPRNPFVIAEVLYGKGWVSPNPDYYV
jgi:hypothetical protein